MIYSEAPFALIIAWLDVTWTHVCDRDAEAMASDSSRDGSSLLFPEKTNVNMLARHGLIDPIRIRGSPNPHPFVTGREQTACISGPQRLFPSRERLRRAAMYHRHLHLLGWILSLVTDPQPGVALGIVPNAAICVQNVDVQCVCNSH